MASIYNNSKFDLETTKSNSENEEDINSVLMVEQIEKYIKEEEKTTQLYQISDEIHKLYNNVINKFRNCENMVYNPNILSNLTEQQFFEFIITNNDEIN